MSPSGRLTNLPGLFGSRGFSANPEEVWEVWEVWDGLVSLATASLSRLGSGSGKEVGVRERRRERCRERKEAGTLHCFWKDVQAFPAPDSVLWGPPSPQLLLNFAQRDSIASGDLISSGD